MFKRYFTLLVLGCFGLITQVHSQTYTVVLQPDAKGYDAILSSANGATIDKLDLSNVSASDFKNGVGSRALIRFDGKDYANPTQALVYGTVTLELMENNKVFAPIPDKYNFDLKLKNYFGRESTLWRDVFTILAHTYHGGGTPYYIYLNGTATIKP